MSTQKSDDDEDMTWRVRRCSTRMRMEARSTLEADGYVIHDEFANPSSDENEELVIVAKKKE